MSKQISPSDFSIEEQNEITKKIYNRTLEDGEKTASAPEDYGRKHWKGTVESSNGTLQCKGYFSPDAQVFRYAIEGLGPYDSISALIAFHTVNPEHQADLAFKEDPYCPNWAKP